MLLMQKGKLNMMFLCVLLIVFAGTSYALESNAEASVTIWPEDVSSPLGRTLFLPCVVIASNDSTVPLSIAWQHNGTSFDPTPHMRIHTPVVMERNGVRIIKSVLEICLTAVDDGGQYSCRAMEGQDVLDEETFHVDAIPPQNPVYVLVPPGDLEVDTGASSHTIAVLCAATGNPPPHITWLRNGHPINNNSIHRTQERIETKFGVELVVGTLEICGLQPQAGGQYTCRAQNQYTTAEESFIVATSVSVITPAAPAVQNVTIDTDHILSCDFVGYPPPAPSSLGWLFNNKPLNCAAYSSSHTLITGSEGEIITRSFLNFKPHSTHFSGEYTCTAEKDDTTVQSSHQLQIQIPAELIFAPVGPSHGITSSIFLSCAAYGIPVPRLTWKRGESTLSNQLITTHERLVQGVYVVTSFLELCPTSEETSSGQYSCQVQNAANSPALTTTSAAFDLCFIGNFGLLVGPADTDIVEGGVYYMPCVAYSRTGRPITITWKDAGGSIINNTSSNLAISESHTTRAGVYFARSILAINCASFEDAMQYTCAATNGIESDYANFNLQFTFGPTINPVGEVNYFRMETESISFTCIVSGQPIPDVTWLKDGEPLVKDPMDYNIYNHIVPEDMTVNSTLILSRLNREDSGVYQCRAQNKLAQVDMDEGYALAILAAPPATGGIQNAAIGYASYTGSVLCILPLIAVAATHLASKHLRSRVETFATLNFCIATSLLYIFYIPSSSGPWSHTGPLCALFSALFHVTFLLATFSISNLLFLRLFRTFRKVKLIYSVALILNWGLPLVILAISVSPDPQYYMKNGGTCVPIHWPLWLGLLLPFVLIHAITWVTLFFSPLISKFSSGDGSWCREAIPIGAILFLFELAWGLQIAVLTTDDLALPLATALQSVFIASSACLGLVALLCFCFFHIRSVYCCKTKSSPEDKPEDEPQDFVYPTTDIKVIALPVKQSFEGEGQVIAKLADL